MGIDKPVRIVAGPGVAARFGQMPVGVVEPVRANLGCERPVGGPGSAWLAPHLDYTAGRERGKICPGGQRDVVRSSVDTVDDEITAVLKLVSQPFCGDPPDDPRRHRCGGVEHGKRPLSATQGALHGADNVAALAHGAERWFSLS